MTEREVLKLALEALEKLLSEYYADTTTRDDLEKAEKAITAIREALAQPEQEPVALPEKIYEFVPTPEPVKWHHPECEGECLACLIERAVQDAYGSVGLGYLQQHLITPPQRTWVGLTDEEIKEIIGPWGPTPIKGYTRDLFDKIEAKLKEKNT